LGQCEDLPTGAMAKVSAGYGHSCGLMSDGTIDCWGLDTTGQCDVPW